MVGSKLRDGLSVLQDLRTSGCLKMLFPRSGSDALTGILLNTAGGITGGDHIEMRAVAGAGSHLTLSTQAAERIYRAQPGETGRVETHLTVEAGARLDWLPQETILFDHAALNRRQHFNLQGDARLLMAEALVLGRTAMGEQVRQARVNDQIRISREGQVIFADTLRLSGDVSHHMAGNATGGGAVALASVLLVTARADEAEQILPRVRALLPKTAGASLPHPGVLYLRLLASDSFELRKTLLPVLTLLNAGPVPRTWMI